MEIIPNLQYSAMMVLPFLVALVGLNVLLFRPIQAYLAGRHQAIHGARAEADRLKSEIEQRMSDLDTRVSESNKRAAVIRDEARKRGVAAEREAIEAARTAADAELTKALDSVSAEKETAKKALAETAESLSADIASRVLDRSIHA